MLLCCVVYRSTVVHSGAHLRVFIGDDFCFRFFEFLGYFILARPVASVRSSIVLYLMFFFILLM